MIKHTSMCRKHNLLKDVFVRINKESEKVKKVCCQCAGEFYQIIPKEIIINSTQGLIQEFEFQTNQNLIKMNLLVDALTLFGHTIQKSVQNIINDTKSSIQYLEFIISQVRNNILLMKNIKMEHQKCLQQYQIFKSNAIKQLENLKSNPEIYLMISTAQLLDVQSLNYEAYKNEDSGIGIQNEPYKNQGEKCEFKRYEYQEVPQTTEMNLYCLATAFNSDASIFLAGDSQQIQVFEFRNEKLKFIQSLSGHEGPVSALQFAKKRNQFFSASWDEKIKIWQLNNKNQWINTETLMGHLSLISSLIINLNEDLLISGGYDQFIIFWRFNHDKWTADQRIKSSRQILYLSLNESNTKLISSSGCELISVFELKGHIWETIQLIDVDKNGSKICFIGEDQFVYLSGINENLQFFYFNFQSHYFDKYEELEITHGQKNDDDLFPIKYIKSKNLLIVKTSKQINIIRKQQDGKFILNQRILFENEIIGSVSDDGLFLLIYNNTSDKFQVRKLVQII